MRYVDEFRDPARARALAGAIAAGVEGLRARRASVRHAPLRFPLQFMEFCGGHTHTIFRYGIPELLPGDIELVHGPGCPVCVLPRSHIDDCVALAGRAEVILATFGDVLRVPGSRLSLAQARAEGADVRMVYSPLDALALARSHPQREVVFFAIGFETTMPATALTLLQAAREGVTNFSLYCSHVTTLPIVQGLLEDPQLRLDGLLAPGHVSAVLGEEPFRRLVQHYRVPMVITGFEPLDVLQALLLLLRQLERGEARLENQYARVVRPQGNPAGRAAMWQVFELRDDAAWRGLGTVAGSGVRIREAYARYDAARRFGLEPERETGGEPAPCAAVLKGRLAPRRCPHFGRDCTPAHPLGALMVSAEGACAAYHRFGHREADVGAAP